MTHLPVVEAIVVNHNTSLFAELALRSLAACHAGSPNACVLRVTVRDNHSSDSGLEDLKDAALALDVPFELSAWPATRAAINTHGDVLRDFLLEHGEADYFLFVDADIDFDEPSTVAVMLKEISADAGLWAVQARFRWLEENRGKGASLNIWTGRPVDLKVATSVTGWDQVQQIRGQIRPRVHPGCTLVRNIEPVRAAAATLGFGVAFVQSVRPEVAGLFDTAGLASAALAVAGLRYALSSATVHHFFNVSYETKDLNLKMEDCRSRLRRFR